MVLKVVRIHQHAKFQAIPSKHFLGNARKPKFDTKSEWHEREENQKTTTIISLVTKTNLVATILATNFGVFFIIQCKPDILRLVGSKQWYRDISGSTIYRASVMSQNQAPFSSAL